MASVAEKHGIAVLRRILKRARWDDQGGYVSRYKGKWTFVSSGLPQASPAEWDALFALAGIIPDEIQSLGSCSECAHAQVGADGKRYERGYEGPCSPCKRPKMSNFVPLRTLGKRARRTS